MWMDVQVDHLTYCTGECAFLLSAVPVFFGRINPNVAVHERCIVKALVLQSKMD